MTTPKTTLHFIRRKDEGVKIPTKGDSRPKPHSGGTGGFSGVSAKLRSGNQNSYSTQKLLPLLPKEKQTAEFAGNKRKRLPDKKYGILSETEGSLSKLEPPPSVPQRKAEQVAPPRPPRKKVEPPGTKSVTPPGGNVLPVKPKKNVQGLSKDETLVFKQEWKSMDTTLDTSDPTSAGPPSSFKYAQRCLVPRTVPTLPRNRSGSSSSGASHHSYNLQRDKVFESCGPFSQEWDSQVLSSRVFQSDQTSVSNLDWTGIDQYGTITSQPACDSAISSMSSHNPTFTEDTDDTLSDHAYIPMERWHGSFQPQPVRPPRTKYPQSRLDIPGNKIGLRSPVPLGVAGRVLSSSSFSSSTVSSKSLNNQSDLDISSFILPPLPPSESMTTVVKTRPKSQEAPTLEERFQDTLKQKTVRSTTEPPIPLPLKPGRRRSKPEPKQTQGKSFRDRVKNFFKGPFWHKSGTKKSGVKKEKSKTQPQNSESKEIKGTVLPVIRVSPCESVKSDDSNGFKPSDVRARNCKSVNFDSVSGECISDSKKVQTLDPQHSMIVGVGFRTGSSKVVDPSHNERGTCDIVGEASNASAGTQTNGACKFKLPLPPGIHHNTQYTIGDSGIVADTQRRAVYDQKTGVTTSKTTSKEAQAKWIPASQTPGEGTSKKVSICV